MRSTVLFLLATTLSTAAFAQTGSDTAAQPLYPPSAPVNTSAPSSSAGIIPQSAPIAPATIGPAPTNPVAQVDPTLMPPQVPAAPGNSTPPAAVPSLPPETTPPAQTAATPAPAPVPLQKKADGFAQEGEEIGYDPKVKRDPYGKAIGGEAAKTETQKLRGDSKRTMRSDVKKSVPAAAAKAPATAPTAKQAGGPGVPVVR